MLIPAIRLTPYLEKLYEELSPAPSKCFGAMVQVQFSSGKPWQELPISDVQALADQQQVFGIGSASRLKYVKLDVTPEAAEETLARVRLAPPTLIRERLKSPDSSKTITNEHVNGETISFLAFKHKRNYDFSPQRKQQFQ